MELKLVGITDGLGVIESVNILYFLELFCRGKLCFGQPVFLIVDDMMFLKDTQILFCEFLFGYQHIDIFVKVLAVFFAQSSGTVNVLRVFAVFLLLVIIGFLFVCEKQRKILRIFIVIFYLSIYNRLIIRNLLLVYHLIILNYEKQICFNLRVA